MKKIRMPNIIGFIAIITIGLLSSSAFAIDNNASTTDDSTTGIVVKQITKEAQANKNWKTAFLTGKHAQIVFMNVSPATNPKNEIGMEKHPFDQMILVVEGHGKTILNGKTSMIKTGDLIFIPQGVNHDIINLDQNHPLKIISFYSATDIPAKSEFKTKASASD